MIKHLIKIEGELFEIPLKVYNHLEDSKKYSDELEDMLIVEIEENYRLENKLHSEIKRADELENTLAYIKSHLDNLWYNGDATEHEYAYNTLKYIESLQENNNA